MAAKRPAKPRRPAKTRTVTPVDALKHKDKRPNIPTEELREFVRDEEQKPRVLLYPRDPSLDPQLVWKGKDQQDNSDLAVPAVPIYIQEHIHPQALIENLRQTAKAGHPEPEISLFADFDGLADDFTKKLDFYSHDVGTKRKWTNRMILGDSLLVMASLAEKEGQKGHVQMIYMDPPYGIKFGSNWQVSTRRRDVRDGKLEDVTRQPEQIRAFRDTWELGIHSYLAYWRDRFVVGRELLTETGSIFVQIGDENMHLVRCLLDEVFGSENFISLITFAKTTGFEAEELPRAGDYLLWYAKNRNGPVKFRPLFEEQPKQAGQGGYRWFLFPDGSFRGMTARELRGEQAIPSQAIVYEPDNMLSQGKAAEDQSFVFRGRTYSPGPNHHWKATFPVGMERLARATRIHAASESIRYVRQNRDFALRERNNVWIDTVTGQFTEEKIFVVQTNTKVIERCMLMTTDPGDLVLDPTCGSGTTAYVAEQWGRRWITIDTSRVALALARTRIMSAKYPYYLLMDSEAGAQKEAEITGNTAALASIADRNFEDDVRKSFVYKRVPHVTLKSIANNDEIDEIHPRFEGKLVPLREKLNALLNERWEEWEVPREVGSGWPEEARELHEEWWRLRRERQREIDAGIARRADVELLYDQPYEHPRRIRVAGPFTVESLSPHRVLSEDVERSRSEAAAGDGAEKDLARTILDNLRVAGVQNTKRNERLKFDRLEPYAGGWIQAAGEYTDAEGSLRRVAISIGPEHGTVGQHHIQEAAKEALKGVGFDLLLVLGFAFDPHASETAREISPDGMRVREGFVAEWRREYGRLPVLLVRMNPDLPLGDEFLKKTGAANLFMVFGEPDIDIRPAEDRRLEVEIRGVDIYDPTTGVIRNSSPDEIACWFIDSNYRRALRAEVDEAAWESLYRTVSRPFDPPETGKIAVKVINHYGDEVIKVYDVKGMMGAGDGRAIPAQTA